MQRQIAHSLRGSPSQWRCCTQKLCDVLEAPAYHQEPGDSKVLGMAACAYVHGRQGK